MSGSRFVPFAGGFLLAAGLAAAGWILRIAPERDAAASRVSAAEESARRSGREASDARNWAESERHRAKELDDRVRELERVLGGSSPDLDPATERAARNDPPESWDRARLDLEIANLAKAKDMAERHQRYPLVLRALKAGGDAGAAIVFDLLRTSSDPAMTAAAATLADGLGDPRAVPLLMARTKTETETIARTRILRALANLPGDDALPLFREVWADPSFDGNLRKFALQGLAVRGDPVAVTVAETPSDGERQPAALRVIAIEWLRVRAERGKWKDTALVPVFGKALRTADGPEQRRIALTALEGFWSKDSLADLDAFAGDAASPREAADRAKRAAEAIRSGAPRPEGAGSAARSQDPGTHR